MAEVNGPVTLTSLKVEGFGCVKDTTLQLGRLHALVGPNDSGKSTLLAAVGMVADVYRGGAAQGVRPSPWPKGGAVPSGLPPTGVPVVVPANGPARGRLEALLVAPDALPIDRDAVATWAKGVHLFRPDPQYIGAPGQLLPDGVGLVAPPPNCAGLASWYDVLMNRDFDGFLALRDAFVRDFPSVAKLGLANQNGGKAFRITLRDGAEVDGRGMSEGMLYWLAIRILEHVQPPTLLLVEEPENGLHPARIAEVMAIYRKLSERTQILIATHSPLVVNALRGDEITVVTRDPEAGTQTVRLCDTPEYEARSQVYQNGELWLSYCDGVMEAPLRGVAG